MRTKEFRYGVIPILLAIALVISMLLVATPVFATTATPPDDYVSVSPGGVFLLRGTITFDQAEAGDFMWGPIYWYHYGDPTENFCLENTPSVYWSDGTPVENLNLKQDRSTWDYAIPNGWQIEITTDGENLIERNGTFYVDIWLRAASGDGTPHKLDNQWIYFVANQITLFEPDLVPVPAGPIYVDVTAPPVGGIAFPADKLALLAPYIILAALIAIVSVPVAVYLRRR